MEEKNENFYLNLITAHAWARIHYMAPCNEFVQDNSQAQRKSELINCALVNYAVKEMNDICDAAALPKKLC